MNPVRYEMTQKEGPPMANKIKGITIEINGDVTKLKKALEGVESSAKKTTQELKQINQQLKYDPSNTTLIAQKHELLGKQVKDTKEKLETLKVAQEQFDQEALKTEEGAEQWRALQREIEKTEGQLKNLKKEYSETNSATTALNNVGDKLQDVGGKMTSVGDSMTKKVTGPIVAGATAAVSAFKEVDAGMDIVTEKTGASGKALEEMQNSAKNLAKEIPTDFETAGSAIGEVNTRFQLTGQKLEDLSGQFIKFAKLNDMDVSNAVDQTQKALSAFGLGAEDASGLLDQLNRVGQNTGASMDSLLSGLIQNGTAFQELGLSAGQSAELMGQMEKSGANSETVMQGLRKALKNATAEGKPLDQALKELQDTIKNGKNGMDGLTAAYDLFGKSGDQIYGAVKNGSLDFANLGAMAEDAGGSVSDTFEEARDPIDDFKTTMNNLKVTLAEVAVPIMQSLKPALEKVGDVIKTLSEKWQGLSEGQQMTIIKIAGVAAAIGPLLSVIGRLTTGIGGIAKGIGAVIANPIPALIAAAVAAIAFAVYEIVKHWEEIKAWFVAFKDALVEMFGAIGEWFSEKFTAAKDAVKNAWTGMVEFFVGIKDGIVQAWENLKQGIHDRLEAIRTACVEIPQNIYNSVSQKFEEIKEAIRTKVEEAKNAVTNIFNNIKSNIKTIIDAIRESVRGTFENIKAFITNPIQYTKDRVAHLFDGIKNTIKDKIEYARDIVQNAVERIKGFFNFSWSLPDLKLPHIVVGSYINVPVLGTIPDPRDIHVEWYKKAYDNAVAFTSPTVLPTLSGMKGFGDGRGAEIVMGEDLFRKYAGDTINVAINVTAQPGQNVNQLADIIESKMIQKVRREQRVFG